MIQFDENKLEALLTDGKDAEAKAYIQEAIEGAPSQTAADKAIDYATAYMEAMNAVNARYLASLKETASLLNELKSAEGKIEDSYKVAKLKADIAGKK